PSTDDPLANLPHQPVDPLPETTPFPTLPPVTPLPTLPPADQPGDAPGNNAPDATNDTGNVPWWLQPPTGQ
ncbi:MAG: hypothetical protein FWB80_15400, partial [Defluviitaleaceae bacterium]|nr:hypothetical protein [Defluviitaleaceae bacterium]